MECEYSIIAYGRVYNPKDWFYNPAYIVNRIYYIVSGSAYYRKNIKLKAGFLYIFRATSYFEVSQEEDDPVDHVYFDFLTYKRLINTDFIEIDLSKHPMLQHQLHAIAEDFSNPSHQSNIAKAYLEILVYYLKDYLEPEVYYSEITSTVLKILHNYPIADLSIDQLAIHMNRNVNHIIRCFKREIGMTPHKYIAMMKVDMAISYIRQGMSCTEIAEKLGFGSLSAFSYFFKTETKRNLTEFKSFKLHT